MHWYVWLILILVALGVGLAGGWLWWGRRRAATGSHMGNGGEGAGGGGDGTSSPEEIEGAVAAVNLVADATVDRKAVFTQAPFVVAKVRAVTPLGNLSPAAHTY